MSITCNKCNGTGQLPLYDDSYDDLYSYKIKSVYCLGDIYVIKTSIKTRN